jgi:hypothetical protein
MRCVCPLLAHFVKLPGRRQRIQQDDDDDEKVSSAVSSEASSITSFLSLMELVAREDLSFLLSQLLHHHYHFGWPPSTIPPIWGWVGSSQSRQHFCFLLFLLLVFLFLMERFLAAILKLYVCVLILGRIRHTMRHASREKKRREGSQVGKSR